MPKEVIKHEEWYRVEGEPSDAPLSSHRTKVEVGWGGRGLGDVHLFIGMDSETPDVWGGGTDLTRDEINSLIRNLRRARDAAFGRDE